MLQFLPIITASDSSALTNHRPISVLISLLRFLEKIVYKKLLNFISDNNIFVMIISTILAKVVLLSKR